MVLYSALSILVGWLMSLAGLDTLFHNLMGFTSHEYYIMWLIIGALIWFKPKDKGGATVENK